jgi:hypothetical protein
MTVNNQPLPNDKQCQPTGRTCQEEMEMSITQSGGSERRSYFRITYTSFKKPKLKIDATEFDVADITQGGIRFMDSNKTAFPDNPIVGMLTFPDGEALKIEAHIEWIQENQVGLSLKTMIPSNIIDRERRRTILGSD